jgi:hypothetical protein
MHTHKTPFKNLIKKIPDLTEAKHYYGRTGNLGQLLCKLHTFIMNITISRVKIICLAAYKIH